MISLSELQHLVDYEDLAKLIHIHPKQMLTDLYKRGSGYSLFLIAKKSGGFRRIESPQRTHRKIQSLVKSVVDQVYRRPEPVHGFVPKRSVVSNALPHIRRRTVVNLDIESFFESITFQRVRGIFLAPPFCLGWSISNILAHACCCEGHLSTGGVASPSISNLILGKLDKTIASLTSKLGGVYTRYCDDLTISFPIHPGRLNQFIVISDGKYYIAPILEKVINDSGFSINKSKFRVSTGAARKVVTGLVVNDKPNLRRNWIRSLECQIYAAETFGLGHLANGLFPKMPKNLSERAACKHLQGKISYLLMVRGRTDWIATGLAHRVNKISAGKTSSKLPEVEFISVRERVARGLWIVTGHKARGKSCYDHWENQGSAFSFTNDLILTSDHVIVGDDGKPLPFIYVRRARNPSVLYSCSIVVRSAHVDIAILRLDKPVEDCRVQFTFGNRIDAGDKVLSVGYPDYWVGHNETVQNHTVLSVRTEAAVSKIRVDGMIQGGVSGGPLLDSEFHVVGIIHRGIIGSGLAPGMFARSNEAISIEEAVKILRS